MLHRWLKTKAKKQTPLPPNLSTDPVMQLPGLQIAPSNAPMRFRYFVQPFPKQPAGVEDLGQPSESAASQGRKHKRKGGR